MLAYSYRARDKAGQLISGTIKADSESAVLARLKQVGSIPVVIKEVKESWKIPELFKYRRIKSADLNMFTRELFSLLRAGLPIISALEAIKEQSTNPMLGKVVNDIIQDIHGGERISEALQKHPYIFNTLYVNMIRAGEVTGRLDEILERLLSIGEYEEKNRLRINSAMRYPLIIFSTMIVGFLILTNLIIPRFAKLYAQFKATLPLPTRVILGINYVTTRYWWFLIIIGVGTVYLFKKFINTKRGRLWWDSLKLKTPIFGPLILKMIMSRFSRITSVMMRSGVPILSVLSIASGSTGNVVVAATVDNIRKSVNEGKGMSAPMRASGVFPAPVVRMVAVGEETGKIDELLYKISDYYDMQVDYTISNMVVLIEPLLIFVMGFMVLLMALGMFLPMWNIMRLFQRQ